MILTLSLSSFIGIGPGDEDGDVVVGVADVAFSTANAADDQLPHQILAGGQRNQLVLRHHTHHISQNQETPPQL